MRTTFSFPKITCILRNLIVAGLFVVSVSQSTFAVEKEFKVTLIYTEGGGGHKAAMLAFEEALKTYPNKPENVKITFHKVDPPMSTCVGRAATQYWDTCFEEAYYDLLAPGLIGKDIVENQIFPFIAAVDQISKCREMRSALGIDSSPLETLLMKKGRPDLILSLINHGNAQFLAIAQKHRIPFRIGVTDYKIDSFIDGIGHHGAKYSREELEVYVPSDANEVTDELKRRKIPYVVTGYPISPAISRISKDLREKRPETLQMIHQILGSYQVHIEDSILFVMMGAKGFDRSATEKYIQAIRKNARALHHEGRKLHLFLAAGQNEKLRSFGKMLAVENNDEFSIHPLAHLSIEEVAAFMGIYQLGNPFLLFTKPGGSTTGQAEAMGTPTLYSLNPIEHERFNAELMKSLNYADTIDMKHRALTLHPQKVIELSVNGVEKQVKKVSEALNTLTFPFNLFEPIQQITEGPASTLELIRNSVLSSLPSEITNQDLVDEVTLIRTLRKYLVEGEKFSTPPENRFSEIIAPIIYGDIDMEI